MVNIIYLLLALSVIIAAVGIVITLVLSVYERRRELGLVRAVGMTRSQVRSSVRWESVITAALGTVQGLVVGLLLGYAIVVALRSEGLNTFTVPWRAIIAVLIIAFLIGVVAAIYPARKATKVDILDAIATHERLMLGSPLARKLGIGEGAAIAPSARFPTTSPTSLAPLPPGVRWKKAARAPVDLVIAFFTRRADVLRRWTSLTAAAEPTAWCGWRGPSVRAASRPTSPRTPSGGPAADRVGGRQGVRHRRDLERLKMVLRKELRAAQAELGASGRAGDPRSWAPDRVA